MAFQLITHDPGRPVCQGHWRGTRCTFNQPASRFNKRKPVYRIGADHRMKAEVPHIVEMFVKIRIIEAFEAIAARSSARSALGKKVLKPKVSLVALSTGGPRLRHSVTARLGQATGGRAARQDRGPGKPRTFKVIVIWEFIACRHLFDTTFTQASSPLWRSLALQASRCQPVSGLESAPRSQRVGARCWRPPQGRNDRKAGVTPSANQSVGTITGRVVIDFGRKLRRADSLRHFHWWSTRAAISCRQAPVAIRLGQGLTAELQHRERSHAQARRNHAQQMENEEVIGCRRHRFTQSVAAASQTAAHPAAVTGSERGAGH